MGVGSIYVFDLLSKDLQDFTNVVGMALDLGT